LTPIRVLIVDDHDLFRLGLTTILRAESDIEVVAQASRGRLGVQLALELHPTVTLMDIRLPDMTGIEAMRAIIEQDPGARIIALTVATSEEVVEAAVMAGACGYVAKETPVDDVLSAVRAAANGEAWLSPRAAEAVLNRLRREREHVKSGAEAPADLLSPRELDVLRLVAQGLENSEIAAELHISPRTAKNHLSNVLTKLGVSNRVQAATYAVRHGIV
jgi:two-component system, NarL family, response regulator LiaR